MKSVFKFILLMLLLASCAHPVSYQILATPTVPAFPGCQGFGCASIGGRGGVVVAVTNLNNSGAGSLRAALALTYPRIIVFKVSGTIQLQSHLYIDNPYVTVAGQTSLNGVQLKGGGFKIRTHDVIIQGMMIRPGNEATTQAEKDELLLALLQRAGMATKNGKIKGV